MVRVELVADFVRDVIDVKGFPGRVGLPGGATRFGARFAGDTDLRKTAVRGAEDVADVVVGVADHRVDEGLVRGEVRSVVGAERITVRSGDGTGSASSATR